jgi:DNA-binding MarR family transcriptional regulator
LSDSELERAAIFRASLRRFLKQTEVATTGAGLTPQRYDLLLFVQASRGHRLTTTELTTKLQLGQPAVTELVKRAVTAGLLRRTRDDLDRRRVWIELTPAGRDMLLTSFRALRAARAELAASIAQAEEEFRSSA